jgi:hypothetical protein
LDLDDNVIKTLRRHHRILNGPEQAQRNRHQQKRRGLLYPSAYARNGRRNQWCVCV